MKKRKSWNVCLEREPHPEAAQFGGSGAHVSIIITIQQYVIV
jgi:hypothetical protein